MKRQQVFIQAAEQISIQQPLSEQWMEEPIRYQDLLVKAINPSFRDYMSPGEVRRMGNLMKRALVTALKVLEETGIEHPDAIITGTSIGSLDYTEKFLDAMVENGEEALSPTYFMQSTHNTVGATLGIYTKTHGYNTTYSHGDLSFDHAVLDAWMQMQLGKIRTALVGGQDEMSELYFSLLQKAGYVGQEGMDPCGEVAMSMMLNVNGSPEDLCELAGISVGLLSSADQLKNHLTKMLDEAGMTMDDISAVMTGVNGNPSNDQPYREILDSLFLQMPLLHYKHLFGENYTVSALGVYAAAHCLKKGVVPSFLYEDQSVARCDQPKVILLLNHMKGREFSLILLKKI